MSESLESIIADTRGEAAVLRANKASFSVDRVEQLLDDVARTAEGWLVWLSEGDASIRCGFSVGWLRARYPQWEHDGNARMTANGKDRQYRSCIVPRRANIAMAAEAGRVAAIAANEDRKSA